MYKVESGATRMEDIKNYSNMNGNQMELLLEFDEEEASLLEEMERQEAPLRARSTSHESLVQLEGAGANVQEGFQLMEFPESREETGASSSLENYESVENSDDNHIENATRLESNEATFGDEHSVNAVDIKPYQRKLLERLSESLLNSRTESSVEETLKMSEELLKEPLTQCFLEGVQILRLDMSESELLFAKSAAALKSKSSQSVAVDRTPVTVHSDSHSSVGTEDPVPGPVNTTSSGRAFQFSNHMRDEEERYLRCIQNTQKGNFVKTTADTKHKTKTRTKKKVGKKKIQATKHEEFKIGSPDDEDCSSSPAKKRKMDTVVPQEPRIVNFQCSHCDFKCPFKKENIEEIVEHITPRERFNHLHELPVKMHNFRENIKLNIMIAKNKAKTWVRFSSRLECTSCHQLFPLDVESCDQLIVHYNWCKELFSREKFLSCPYCNDLVHRGSVKKHLGQKSKKQCSMNVALTLQLMSCVCKWYAEEHKPVCIVCNEKCWPYLGHRAELDPVCETCRFNITSGNTTKLKDRDLAGCAICGWQCSEKFVTYWASELESLFIGENCLSKLESPLSQKSVEMANMKEAKVKKLVESAISSPGIHEKGQSKNMSSNSNNQSKSHGSSSTCESESVHDQAQIENTESNFVIRLNRNIASESLTNDGRNPHKSGTQVPATISVSKQIKQTQFDLPVPTRATSGGFIPITGSFQINNNTKLPFASLASVEDNPGNIETVVPASPLNIDKVKSIVQGGVPYTLLLPNDTSRVLFRRCLPKINDGAESPQNVFRSMKPHPEISYVSVNDDSLKANVVQSRENPVSGSGIAKMTISTRSESEGNEKTSIVSIKQLYQASYSSSTPSEGSMRPQEPKYIIKYGSTSTDTSQKNSNQHHEKKNSCIVIKTSSNIAKTKAHAINAPWIAKIIKTPNNVCSGNWQEKSVVTERKGERKLLMMTKNDDEVVNLD